MSIFGQAINIYEVGSNRIWQPYSFKVVNTSGNPYTLQTSPNRSDGRYSLIGNNLVLLKIEFNAITALPAGAADMVVSVPFDPLFDSTFGYSPISLLGQGAVTGVLYGVPQGTLGPPVGNKGVKIHRYDGTDINTLGLYKFWGWYQIR